MKLLRELKEISSLNASFIIDASSLPTREIKELLSCMHSNATLTLKNADAKPTRELKEIIESGENGHIILDFS